MKVKNFFLFAATAATLLSCSDIDQENPRIRWTSINPTIEVLNSENNNFTFKVGDNIGAKFEVKLHTSEKVICDLKDDSFNYAFQVSAENDEPHRGQFSYTIEKFQSPIYTVDNSFVLVQSVWEDTYKDYEKYGAIETFVNVKDYGTDGTLYIDMNWTETNYNDITSYEKFIKGKLVAVSEIKEESREFECLHNDDDYFEEWGYTPNYYYTAQTMILTIETSQGNFDISVYGKKRDKELERLLNYVKVGDTIEVPGYVDSYKDLQSKKFGEILSCQVYRID